MLPARKIRVEVPVQKFFWQTVSQTRKRLENINVFFPKIKRNQSLNLGDHVRYFIGERGDARIKAPKYISVKLYRCTVAKENSLAAVSGKQKCIPGRDQHHGENFQSIFSGEHCIVKIISIVKTPARVKREDLFQTVEIIILSVIHQLLGVIHAENMLNLQAVVPTAKGRQIIDNGRKIGIHENLDLSLFLLCLLSENFKHTVCNLRLSVQHGHFCKGGGRMGPCLCEIDRESADILSWILEEFLDVFPPEIDFRAYKGNPVRL